MIESDGCQGIMQDHLAGICYELNKIKANNPNIEIDDLVSKMKLFVVHCDTVLMENEEISGRLDVSLKETALLETKLYLEKKQREEDLSSSYCLQEVEQDEKYTMLNKLKNIEEKLNCSIKKYNSIMQENEALIQKQRKLKLKMELLEGELKSKNATIAHLNRKLRAVSDDCLGPTSQKTESWRKDKWADDSVLSDYFSAMADSVSTDEILFLGPSATAVIKLGSSEMSVECLERTSFYKCKYVFLCINNSDSVDVEDSGSHWSLLFVERLNNTAYHFDSLSPMNHSSAQMVAGNLGISKSKLISMPCIQQKQSFECGIHVLANAKYIAYHYCVNNMSERPFTEWFRGIRALNHTSETQLLVSPSTNTHRTSQINSQGNSKATGWYEQSKKPNKRQSSHTKKLHAKWKPFKSAHTITRNRFEILNKITDDNDCESVLNLKHTQPLTKPKTNKSYNKEASIKSILTRQKSENRIIIGSDSQGRGLSSYLYQASNVRSNVLNYCKPGAPLEVITHSITSSVDFKELSSNDWVILIGGTNNINNESVSNPKQFLRYFTDYLEEQQQVFKGTNLILSTIPYRYDLHSDSHENQLIKEVNTVIRQLTYNYSHVKLLDLYLLQRCYHTRHGLHINKRGKIFICKEIIKISKYFVNDLNSESPSLIQKSVPPLGFRKRTVISSQTKEMAINQQPSVCSSNPIRVIEQDMAEKIVHSQDDTTIAFAHCVSADFGDPRHMSRGVAVVFGKAFGRPKRSDLVSSAIALQRSAQGAVIYSLVTKPTYCSKPTVEDYNQAFQELIVSFKVNKLKKLICSPMGCTRDKINPQLFSRNIVQFYRSTGAEVDIMVQDERATRTLRNGLEYDDFVTLLRDCIAREMATGSSPPTPTTIQAAIQPATACGAAPSTDAELSFDADGLSVHGASVNCSFSVQVPVDSFSFGLRKNPISSCTRGSTLNSSRIVLQEST